MVGVGLVYLEALSPELHTGGRRVMTIFPVTVNAQEHFPAPVTEQAYKGVPPLPGCCFAFKTQLVNAHILTPHAIIERITSLRLPLPKKQFITLVSV